MRDHLTNGTRVTRIFHGGDSRFAGIRHGEIVGAIIRASEEPLYDVLWDDDHSYVDWGYQASQLEREVLLAVPATA